MGITISDFLKNKRQQLNIDKFARFQWGEHQMFDKYGAFIVNNKDSLQFYNGPSFSNKYSQPQFNDAPSLVGVTLNTQKIAFTMGVCYFTDKEWREILNLFNPFVISALTFGYEPKLQYFAKVSKFGDSTRYILGHFKNEPYYYTEIKIEFDVQGTPCAHFTTEFQWNLEGNIYRFNNSLTDYYSTNSDLPMPFKIRFKVLGNQEQVSCKISNIDFELFSFSTINNSSDTGLYFEYDSETGLIYWSSADTGDWTLLTLLNTSTSGKKIVKNLMVNRYMYPGCFRDSTLKLEDYEFSFRGVAMGNEEKPVIVARGRTTIV